jgi:hypothetical protein
MSGDLPGDTTVNVIVRFHDPRRLGELGAALLCLIGQVHRPLRVMVVTQRFDAAAHAALEARLEPYRAIDPTVAIDVVPYTRADGRIDARSALLNAGIDAMRGRYLAVLDYDDTLYQEAYALLLHELRASDCAIAIASVACKSVATDPAIALGLSLHRGPPIACSGVTDIFRASCTPFHGIMFDTSRIAVADLRFDEELSMFEDHELFLRLAARYRISCRLLGRVIGDYRFKDDGSNTVPLPSKATARYKAMWERGRLDLEARKRHILVEPVVQEEIGISPPRPGLSIHGLVEGLDSGEIVPRPRPYLLPRLVRA